MKNLYTIIIVLFFVSNIYGKDVSVEQAQGAATAFLQKKSAKAMKIAPAIRISLQRTFPKKASSANTFISNSSTESPELYIFTINQTGGFIIISGDDAAIPVLGYSLTEKLDTSRALPENLRYWMEEYQQQIRLLRSEQVEASGSVKKLWNNLSNPQKVAQSAVSPLLKTQWSFDNYYNNACPFDTFYQEHAVVGCVAVAMSQILKYWEYPSKGFGIHAYKHKRYGVVSANFGATLYDWASMPVSVTAPNEAVATLMYHCGVSVDMIYGVGGSGAAIFSPDTLLERQTAETAFSTFFGYSPSLRGVYRANYSDSDWKGLLKSEIDSGRPIYYGGCGVGYAHAFVCDGYDENNYFHMNWGWGGDCNGYFLLDALAPIPDYPFNLSQQALIGLKPKDPTKEAVLELTGSVVTNKLAIDYGEGFTITSNCSNVGSEAFYGDLGAAIFDDQFFQVDLIGIKKGQNLSSKNKNSYELSFASSGIASLTPGTYRVYVKSRPTGNFWGTLTSKFGDTSTKDYTEIKVTHSDEICLYSSMHSSSSPTYANDKLSVWVNVENKSASDFRGSLMLSLYTKAGVFVDTIEEKTNLILPSNSHFADSLNFYNAHIPTEPGDYILKLMYRRDGSDYQLIGSSPTLINPVRIELIEPIPVSDIYENNDSIEIAYQLPVTYTSDKAEVLTPKSNIHSATDVDYYVLTLEHGFEYSVNAMLHDNVLSTNGKNYTLDGLFYYSTDGITWSNVIDDKPSDEILIPEGTLLYFKVKAASSGDVGTYLLDIKIERKIKTATKSINPIEMLVYPNPFTDHVTLTSPEIIQEYRLFDMQGRLQKKAAVGNTQSVIDLSDCSKGMYIIKLVSGDNIYFQKLIKR